MASRTSVWSGLSTWKVFVLAFIACLGCTVAWSLATPSLAGPDEGMHIARAVSLVRGQLLGTPVPGRKDNVAVVEVIPASYAHVYAPTCFLFHPDVPAGCAHAKVHHHSVRVSNYVGRYSPVYYGLIGLPSLLLTGSTGVWGMRLLSAVFSSLLLAAALTLAATRTSRPWLAVGLALALSPLVWFLGGVVSPSSMEISAAVAAAIAVVPVARPLPGRERERGPIVVLGVSIAVLLTVRTISPLWALAAVLALLALAGKGRLGELVRLRTAWWLAAIDAVAAVGAVAWDLYAHPFQEIKVLPVHNHGPLHILLACLGELPTLLGNSIGVFGAANEPSPPLVRGLWYGGIGALLVITLATGSRRSRLVVSAAIAAWVVVAVAINASEAVRYGLVNQGRDFMGVAVFTPILAGALCALSSRRIAARATITVLAMVGVAQLIEFYWELRTMMKGADGPLNLSTSVRDGWAPPVPWPVLLLLILVAVALLGTILYGACIRAAEAGRTEIAT